MNIASTSHLISISQLQRDYVSLISRVKKITEPLLLLRRNQPEAVIISVPAYEDLVTKSRLYEEKMALEAITNFNKVKKAKKLLIANRAEDLFK